MRHTSRIVPVETPAIQDQKQFGTNVGGTLVTVDKGVIAGYSETVGGCQIEGVRRRLTIGIELSRAR